MDQNIFDEALKEANMYTSKPLKIKWVPIVSKDKQIEYIYITLYKQEARYKRNLIFKTTFKVLFFGGILFFYLIFLPKMDLETIFKKYITPKITPIITSMSEDLLNNQMWIETNTDSPSNTNSNTKQPNLEFAKKVCANNPNQPVCKQLNDLLK